MSALDDMEQRVTEKFAAAAFARIDPQWKLDVGEWTFPDFEFEPLPPGTPQFPREQWVTYPNRRMVTLTLIDRALDLELTDEQWTQLTFLMGFGGRERIA